MSSSDVTAEHSVVPAWSINRRRAARQPVDPAVCLHTAALGANVRICRDEVRRITVYLAGGPRLKMRTSEPRDRAPWTLAASVPQAGIDYGAWSRHRGNPHAYPPFGADAVSMAIGGEAV